MIFLVVKVNCPSYVFNISKSIWILRNIKKLGIFRKSAREWFVYFCKWWRHTGKTNKGTGYWSVEWDITLHYTTVVTSKMSMFLTHKRVKSITSYRLSITHNNASKTSVSWYDVTHDGNGQKITTPKTPINLLYFLAFYGIIYQNLLHRRVYIAVSS